MKENHIYKYGVVIFTVIMLLSAIGSYWTSFTNALRITVAGMFLFFIPGWCTTIFFFPSSKCITEDGAQEGTRQQRSLDLIERVTLAVLISIIISSAVVFALHAVSGSMLTPRNLVFAIGSTNLILCAVSAWRKKRFFQIKPKQTS